MAGEPKVRKSAWRRGAGCLGRVGLLGGVGALGLSVVAAAALGWLYYEHVVVNPGPHLDRDHVRAIISQDSPVYFRDGVTRVGVFFDDEHRHFVPWSEVPLAWSMSIVAAEDGAFWSHAGVSLKHITRAMRDNVRAGRMVAGGSTITQQTAKNLYYRPDRSLKSKLTELVNALRLEAHFDKTEILAFYANQFHVTGNGRGLGIAARHFFDKTPAELSLIEAAFIAGLVKGPSRYDPFIGDEARRDRAVAAANGRTRYVLRRVAEEQLVNLVPPRAAGESDDQWSTRVDAARAVQAAARDALDNGFELPFKRGVFRYESSAVLDEVARRLAEPPFAEVLAKAGIDDPASAGLVVVTTLDAATQHAATYGLWHHLTEVGTWLERHTAADFVLPDASPPSFDPTRKPVPWEFRLATVLPREDSVVQELAVDLGGHRCVVDRDGLVRAAVAVHRGQQRDRHAKAPSATVDAFVRALPANAVVRVSVRSVPAEGPARCDLELRPALQGALVVLQHGELRAMVGGNDNRNFNRASALRQMGSTWKPLIFHAAMQLGWAPDDIVDNRRSVFSYSTTFYYPRPDHTAEPEVSISWSGINSENLSSVWLLYHLIDKLDGAAVKRLAGSLGLLRGADETDVDYRARMQKLGVLPTRGRLVEADFLQARQEVLSTLQHARHPEDATSLTSLVYGWGFSAERGRVQSDGPATRAWKQPALDHAWTILAPKIEACSSQALYVQSMLGRGLVPVEGGAPLITVLEDEGGLKVACGAVPAGYVKPDGELVDRLRVARGELSAAEQAEADAAEAEDEPSETSARGARWPFGLRRPAIPGAGRAPRPDADAPPPPFELDDVRVDDRLHVSTLRQVRDAVERRTVARSLSDGESVDLYDPDVLIWHQDFRVTLALRYVIDMARNYGVQTELQPVLSLPLGAAEISLVEAASIYEGISTGESWSFPGTSMHGDVAPPLASTLLIAEVRDVDGNVIYRAKPEFTPVGDPGTGALTADILRNVVRWGTGQRALYGVKAGAGHVPLGGKTGTTNEFRNAAFVGFAPVVSTAGYDVAAGYTVAAYVGYDDNRPMVSGRISLAGASGALPAWLLTIDGMQRAGLLGEPVGLDVEASAWPLVQPSDLLRRPMARGTGAVLDGTPYDPSEPSVLVRLPALIPEPRVQFQPVIRPERIAPRTDLGAPRRGRGLWGRERPDQ